jgi:tRNA G18 (ribose-2'-O)-methylase SpoU
MKKQTNILILNDIRSTENVGAMFRTADATGMDKIYITGYTASPVDRFGKKRNDIAKSALGAEESIPWEYKKSLIPLLTKLAREGYKIICLEQDKRSIHYKKIKLGEKNIFIVGNEVTGVDKKILDKADVIGEIPMKGKKESLNVSVSLGIFLYAVLKI